MGKAVDQPVVIAHRGASGYLPEHSLPAKALAFGQGADFLEQDLVASRDGELLVLHDIFLDHVSNVASLYPGRQRDDGHFYCIDFDLDEIKALELHERTRADGTLVYPDRYPLAATGLRITTFAEELGFIDGLIRSAGSTVGIYPEIKSPAWHREQGIDITVNVLDTLDRFDYPQNGRPVYLQCYEPDELKRIFAEVGEALPLIQLISSRSVIDESMLDDVITYAQGIGPSMRLILAATGADGAPEIKPLVSQAHQRGLTVHPYTFRRDDLPAGVTSFDELLELFIGRLGVDGVFTDFPDLVRRWLDEYAA